MSATQQANQALLHGVRRLNAGKHLVGDQVCVIHASFGIDVQATGFAPGSELVRVYVNTDNPDTFCLLSLAAYLGIPEPLVKGAMEFVTVLKYGHEPVEVFALEPHHADGLNLLTHVTTPCIDDEPVTVTDRMSLHRVINCLLAALIALLLSSSYLLDGPSEIDAMRAVQASKQDAIKSAATHAQRTWARGQKDHQFMLAKAAP